MPRSILTPALDLADTLEARIAPTAQAMLDGSDSAAVVQPISREQCNVDRMRRRLPGDVIPVEERLPPMWVRVIGYLSDPRVSIYFAPAIIWRTPNHPGNPDDWWMGVPGKYTKLEPSLGWKLSHWMLLPEGAP